MPLLAPPAHERGVTTLTLDNPANRNALSAGLVGALAESFDACAAAAFVLQVVEPHLVGPAGDMPAVFYSAKSKKVEVMCAQGPSPQAATIENSTSVSPTKEAMRVPSREPPSIPSR